MQKKVYTKDLSLDEIMERLNKGEKVYNDNDGCYIGMYNNALALYEENILVAFNPTIYTNNNQYFLDEVEEPEADGSCIGKLCWFWHNDEKNKRASILQCIDKNYDNKYFAQDNSKYKHCKPLTEKEALALVKE